VLIDGLSAERVLYPDRVPPTRQVDMLDHLLDGLRAPDPELAEEPVRASLSSERGRP
jgi:hypothetical protein